MSDKSIRIQEAQIENLRGYSQCAMNLARERTVLVGRNNSGKTSILRIVDWLVNHAPLPVLEGTQTPSTDLIEFLVPARQTRNRARRLTLRIRVPDRRSHRRFRCVDGFAELRLNLRQTPIWKVYIALGAPARGESAESDERALELLERIRKESLFVYIPSFRDGHSPRFRTTLLDAFRSRLGERVLHAARAGAPSEYRRTTRVLGELRAIAEDLASPLWTDMSRFLPPGLARSAKISLAAARKILSNGFRVT